MWLTTVGLLAAGTGMTVSVPQVVRLLRSTHADGVSLPSTVLGVLTSATWLAYGLLLLDPTQIIANVPGLAGAGVVAILVVRRTGARLLPIVAGAPAWAAVAVTAYLAGGPTAVGLAATTLAVVRQWPQLVRVFGAGSLDALSPLSTGIGVLSASLWTMYGLGVGQPPVWMCAGSGVVISGLVLARRLRPATGRVPAAVPGRLLPAAVPGRLLPLGW